MSTIFILILIASYIQQDILCQPKEIPTKLINYSLPERWKSDLDLYEDSYLNFTQLTTKYKYPTEQHRITTEDGYILSLFRIFPKCDSPKDVPVVLMHGIFDTSDEWILTGPKAGLGYILADDCYDVWAANHRGNYYSRQHVKLNPDTDAEFWNYSFDEHGRLDLPAVIDHVLLKTKKTKVHFVGHSQGTTDFFAMTSMKPEYNEKIGVSFHIAPVVFMKNIASPVVKLLVPGRELIVEAFNNNGYFELFSKNRLAHAALEYLCQYIPDVVCGSMLSLSTGYRAGNISKKNMALAFGHLVAGSSTKEINHLGQLIDTGKFQRYDEGTQGNFIRYGAPTPPDYYLSKVTAAVVLICAQNDWVSSLKDADILRSKLSNMVKYYVVPDPKWSHLDHIYSDNAPKYVFSFILDYLNARR